MKKSLLAVAVALLLSSLAVAQDEGDASGVLGRSRAEILAVVGKPLDEIKDKATIKGLFDSVVVTTDADLDRPNAQLFFLSKGKSVDYVLLTFYAADDLDALQAEKEDMDTTLAENSFVNQELEDLPEGTALYFNEEAEEFVFLADDDAARGAKVIFMAYTADNTTLDPLAKVIQSVIVKVQKDLKL